MATINNRPNGHRWIQFTGLDKRRYTLRLGKVSKKVAQEVQRRVETLISVKLSGAILDSGTAEWLSQTDGAIRERLVKLGLADPRAIQIKLGDWIDQFLEEKKQVKKSTLGTYYKPKANLIDYFGADRLLSTITPGDAEAWRNWVASSSNKRDKKRASLAESTVRRRTGQAKQFFTAAVKRGLIPSNPFEELRSTVHANESRQHFVTREVIDAVIAAAPDAQWRGIIALARYGGLRMPSEMVSLTWDDIDFAAGKMVLRASKTAHHRTGGRRVCPLFPELRPYLEDLYELAPEGSKHVITLYRDRTANMRTAFVKIIERAKQEQWPKLFQNLRASRETELLGIYPAKDVSSWLGNSVPVAMKHYAMARTEVFDAAAITPSGTMPERLPFVGGDVKADAPTTQKATLHQAAGNGADEQGQKKSPRIAGLSQDDATPVHSGQEASMGDTEFESVTSTV